MKKDDEETKLRSCSRVCLSAPVTLEYPDGNSVITRDGTIFDFSKDGMSFYMGTALEKGVNLNVHCASLWDLPRAGTVQWCAMKDLRCYKIGVSFESL